MSAVRISRSSIRPPEKPAIAPARAPSSRAPPAATMETPSDNRPPRTTRAKMSRPRASPPSSSQGPRDSSTHASAPIENQWMGIGWSRSSVYRLSSRSARRSGYTNGRRQRPSRVDDVREHRGGVGEIGELTSGVVRGDERRARRHQRDRDEQRRARVPAAEPHAGSSTRGSTAASATSDKRMHAARQADPVAAQPATR